MVQIGTYTNGKQNAGIASLVVDIIRQSGCQNPEDVSALLSCPFIYGGRRNTAYTSLATYKMLLLYAIKKSFKTINKKYNNNEKIVKSLLKSVEPIHLKYSDIKFINNDNGSDRIIHKKIGNSHIFFQKSELEDDAYSLFNYALTWRADMVLKNKCSKNVSKTDIGKTIYNLIKSADLNIIGTYKKQNDVEYFVVGVPWELNNKPSETTKFLEFDNRPIEKGVVTYADLGGSLKSVFNLIIDSGAAAPLLKSQNTVSDEEAQKGSFNLVDKIPQIIKEAEEINNRSKYADFLRSI